MNLACGSDIKEGFVNVDKWNRDGKVDLVCDLTEEFPFESNSVNYIYCSHFLEHLDWLAGKDLLHHCYHCLKKNGILRIVIPDYKIVFQKYLEVVEQMLKSNKNILYIGGFLDNLGYGTELPGLKKKHSEIYNLPVTIKDAAKMFLLNIPSWRNNEFIKENYSDIEIKNIEEALTD